MWTKHLKWIIPLALVLVIGVWVKNSYNSMAVAERANDAAWGQVQVVLQRRADLIVNLMETVKGSAKFEKDTLENIAAARSGLTAAAAGTRTDQIVAAQKLENVMYQFRLQVEAYPTLQSTQAFRDFMTAQEGSENRIAVERKRYNDAVFAYNKLVVQFPAMIVAKLFGFSAAEQFAAPAEAQTAPKVKFE